MIQIFFNDDEHTAKDAAYERLLKSRKWLYLVATTSLLHAFGDIDYASLSRSINGVVRLEKPHVSLALLFSSSVLFVQYSALLAQLLPDYGKILDERIADANSRKFIDVSSKLQDSITKIAELEDQRTAIETDQVSRTEHMIKQSLHALDIKLKFAREENVTAQMRHESYVARTDGLRPFVVWSERTIDMLRIFAPFFLAIISISLIASSLWH
jgi:hypothetical protein